MAILRTSVFVNSRERVGSTSTKKEESVEAGTAKCGTMPTTEDQGRPGAAEMTAEDGGWKLVGPGLNRKGQGGAEGQGGARADRPTGQAKQAMRKASPTRTRDGRAPNRTGVGKTANEVDQGDGRMLFQQLRNYLSYGAADLYVQHTVMWLHELATERRFKAFLRAIPATERGEKTEKTIQVGWQDEAPDSRQRKYGGLRSTWDLSSAEHRRRMTKLMQEWVLKDKETQREIENRLQFFRFKHPQGGATTAEAGIAATGDGTTISYKAAMTQAGPDPQKVMLTSEQA
jgi:hypothetical protein